MALEEGTGEGKEKMWSKMTLQDDLRRKEGL